MLNFFSSAIEWVSAIWSRMASWEIGGSTGVLGLQRLKAARLRGDTHQRVDGNFLPTTAFPRIDRFKEHTIELPVASLDVTPTNEAALRAALAAAFVGSRQRHGPTWYSHG